MCFDLLQKLWKFLSAVETSFPMTFSQINKGSFRMCVFSSLKKKDAKTTVLFHFTELNRLDIKLAFAATE